MDQQTPHSTPKDPEKDELTNGAKVYPPLESATPSLLDLPQETPPGSAPAVDLPVPEEQTRSWFARLFSTNHRFGRFMRALGRGLVVVIILCSAGALAVEFLRVQPLQKQYQVLQTSATQSATDLQARQTQLEQANQGLTTARGQTVEMQTQLETEQTRVKVLRASNQLTLARLAVANKDTVGAEKALASADGYLKSILPQVEKIDADQAATLQALFTLAKNDISRDQKLFNQDLDRLESELQRLEKNLLQ
jgi:hypothetical protein